MMNKVFLRTDKGEYQPGETVCGAVYLDIQTPTEAHGVQLSFNGKESVCYECILDGNRTTLQSSHDYVDYCKADLFVQKGTFSATGGASGNLWSAFVTYKLRTYIVGADSMMVEQEIVVTAVTPEALRDNYITQAQTVPVRTGILRRKVHVTVKPLANFVKSGECARLKMLLTNQIHSRARTFTIKLLRTLTVTLPYKSKTSLDTSGDHESQLTYQIVKQVEGGPVVIREMRGDLSQHSSHPLSRGGVLDNIMIPLKTLDGKNVIPSVDGKYVQCDYNLQVSLYSGESTEQTITCPISGVLPEENAQWLSWRPQPWMHSAIVKLSKTPGAISPHEQLLGSEAFSRLPRFQDLDTS